MFIVCPSAPVVVERLLVNASWGTVENELLGDFEVKEFTVDTIHARSKPRDTGSGSRKFWDVKLDRVDGVMRMQRWEGPQYTNGGIKYSVLEFDSTFNCYAKERTF
jgi:hypothetical protein